MNYAVLGLALLFEAVTWWMAFRELRRVKGQRGYFEPVQLSKYPTLFTVFFENSAALLGTVVAFVGIFLSQWLDMPRLDGVASLVIGGILAVTAAYLAYECKGLLTGEGAGRAVVSEPEKLIAAQSSVCHLNALLTVHFGPPEILLNISVDFADALTSGGCGANGFVARTADQTAVSGYQARISRGLAFVLLLPAVLDFVE